MEPLAWAGAGAAPFHNVLGLDPGLVDPENGDYRPQPGSPAEAYGCRTFPPRGSVAPAAIAPARTAPRSTVRRDAIEVFGAIAADATWDAETVRVIGDLVVEEGVTLRIEPGVRVEFQDYYGLEVRGTLLALGAPGNRIVFTTDEPEAFTIDASRRGCWKGIRFENTSAANAPSRIEHAVLEYAKAAGGAGGDYPYAGGALSVIDFSALTVERCVFRNNVAGYGGAIFLYRNANPRIAGNLIVGNHALENASAAYIAYSYPALVSNTIVGNPIHNDEDPYIDACAVLSFLGKPVFENDIVRDNDPDYFYSHSQLWKNKDYYTRNNDIEGHAASGGNIDADPWFVDPLGPDGVPLTLDEDLRLQAGSPCIDRGRNEAILSDAATDLDGQARIVDGDADGAAVADMGAFEHPHGRLLSFAGDGATLGWPAVGPAATYNVYRGALAALVDLDGDGLPDGGYGECANDLDPDTSDTTFLDPSLPGPGGGFFYLMSIVNGQGQELLLGTTSRGRPRLVLQPCP